MKRIGQIKRMICILVILPLILAGVPSYSGYQANAAEVQPFSDVSADSWAYDYILTLREIGVTDGMGDNTFGPLLNLKRCEFVKMLVVMMKWKIEQEIPQDYKMPFSDIQQDDWFYPYIKLALDKGIIMGRDTFRPNEDITREDMAIMLVRALGFDVLATSSFVTDGNNKFKDVNENTNPTTLGHIILATDFGIIQGVDDETFNPSGYATREQAAAMMIRLYNRRFGTLDELTAFYAFSSWDQKDMIPYLNSINLGWSKLEYWNSCDGAYLNTTSSNSNSWSIPEKADSIAALLQKQGIPVNLTVFMATSQKVTLPDGNTYKDADLILFDEKQRAKAITQIMTELNRKYSFASSKKLYTGVVIDFEGFTNEKYQEPFNAFLEELKVQLDENDLDLYVALAPIDKEPYNYYKGFDYKRIGELADKIIYMCHDYEATSLPLYERQKGNTATPPTPIDHVYYAVKSLAEVCDPSKIILQLSFDTVRWTVKDGVVSNSTALRSDGPSIYKRLNNDDTEMFYSEEDQDPYIKYPNDEDGSTVSVVWYEDERSYEAKIALAKMLGIGGISIWRLGTVPAYEDPEDKEIYFDLWDEILEEFGR